MTNPLKENVKTDLINNADKAERQGAKFTAEQSAAVMHGGGDILVSASAGSGKTFVMIERIVRLILEKKAAANSILAVTFTIAAAEEMREKLKREISKYGDNQYMKEQIRLLSTADISTVHSFCTGLLRTYFFHTEFAADFEVLDDKEAKLLKEKALDEVFLENYENYNADFLQLTSEFKKNRSDLFLKKLILALYEKSVSRLSPMEMLQNSLSVYDNDGFERVLNELFRQSQSSLRLAAHDFFSFCQNGIFDLESNNLSYANTLKDFLDAKLSASTFECYFAPRFSDLKLRLSSPKSDDKKDAYIEFKAARDTVKKALDDESALIPMDFDKDKERDKFSKSGQTARRLVRLISEFNQKYRRLKLDDNKADFDDLQHEAIKLLEIDEVRQEVLSKYAYIFTDEYQDINEVQERILGLISTDNLFMVGDLKQSIYAFRGCNPEFFSKKQAYFESGFGQSVYLNKNFRSSPAVIDAVNSVFEKIMTNDTAGLNYSAKARLLSGGLYPENSGLAVCHILGGEDIESQSRPLKIYDIYEDIEREKKTLPDGESLLIADIVADCLGRKYYDIKSGEYRDITLSDIVILARNRTQFAKIRAALTSGGIPSVSDVKEDILAFPEIKFIIELLKFIDNSAQDIPAAAVLKYIGKVSENELAAIRARFFSDSFYKAVLDYKEQIKDEISQKIAKTLEYFEKIRLLADFEGALTVINKVFADCNLYLHFAAAKNGGRRIERIGSFLKEAKKKDRQLSCREFLKSAQALGEGLSLSGGGADDAVRLMTVHASKGLEYPVVIVANLGRNFVLVDEKQEVFSDNEYGIAPKFFDTQNKISGETVLRKLIKLNMRRQTIQDEMRNFYVALTRAQYELHLVNTKPTADKSIYGIQNSLCLSDFLGAAAGFKTVYRKASEFYGAESSPPPTRVLIAKPDKELKNKIYAALNCRYPFENELNLPAKISVTAAAKTESEVYEFLPLEKGEDRAFAERGSAYHTALEFADFASGQSAADLIEDLTAGGKLTAEGAKLINAEKLDEILCLDIFKDLKGREVYKEREFFVTLPASAVFENAGGEILVQGVIDLIVKSSDGAHIIDYKYSSMTDESLIKRYKAQLFYYKAAYEKITGEKVNKLTLINILSQSVINIL